MEAQLPWGIAGADARQPQPPGDRALTAPRCPQVYRRHSRWLSMREWRAMGVTPLGRSLAGQ